MIVPKPIFSGYASKDDIVINTSSVLEFWLCNEDGHTILLKWWGNGWVIKSGNSYFCKDKTFQHKDDISSFDHSSVGMSNEWKHVFQTKEKAVEFFRTRNFPSLPTDEEFYNKVYDILVNLGGASADISYREAFIFNFSKKEIFPDREWRFQGKLGFGGKYRNELNSVDCYQEDETPERLELIAKINEELKGLVR